MYNGKPHGYPSYQPYPPPQGEPSNAGWIPPTLNYPPDPYPQAPGGYYNMPMTGPGPSPNSYNVHAQASSTSPFHATPPFPSAPPSFSTGYTPPGGSSATSELGPTEGGTTGVAGMGLGLGGDSDQDKSVSGGPKKRRKTIAAASGSPTADDGKEKRTKTGRACDACVRDHQMISKQKTIAALYADLGLPCSGQRRSAATSSRSQKAAAKINRYVHTASSTTSNVHFSSPSPKPGSRRRKQQVGQERTSSVLDSRCFCRRSVGSRYRSSGC
jgi:hypothetical protein